MLARLAENLCIEIYSGEDEAIVFICRTPVDVNLESDSAVNSIAVPSISVQIL